MSKQSREDQIKRLENFSCPIHGVSFGQITFAVEGASFTVGECSRKDCDITVIVDSRNGELEVRQVVTHAQLRKLESIWAGLFREFSKEAKKKLNAELDVMAREKEVQLPVSR